MRQHPWDKLHASGRQVTRRFGGLLKGAARRANRVLREKLAAHFGRTNTPAAADDRLDAYAKTAPSVQATLDIFKGVWSSRYPAHYGVEAGAAELFEDARIQWLIGQLGDIQGYRVLELGPLEGAHSFMMEKAGASSVVAVEACVASYLKCLITKELMALSRVKFEFGDFMPYLKTCERFDLILASGVLYHQRDPISCLKRIADRTDKVFIWTHYFTEGFQSERLKPTFFEKVRATPIDGFQCDLHRLKYETYLPGGKYRGGVDDHVHWMSRDSLLACLEHFGFDEIRIASEQSDHPYGPNIALLARRSEPMQEREYAAEMHRLAGPVPWCIDSITIDGDVLSVSGWAIPIDGDVGRGTILVDGRPADELTIGVTREDVALYYWYFAGAKHSGFHLRHRIEQASGDIVRLCFADQEAGASMEALHDIYLSQRALQLTRAVPAMNQIQRIHGGNTPNQFLVEGYALFATLELVLQSRVGRRFADFDRVLDFGCGCGRLSRHFDGVLHKPIVGVDIDAENVAWCRSNLAGEFYTTSIRPPLEIPSASFDCIVAIQVFTHLTEVDAELWLTELARVCQPGGIAIASIASTRALTRAKLSLEHHKRVKHFDFLDLSRNPDLDGVVAEPDYYRNVFYTHERVRMRWPRHGFEVVDVIAGAVGNHYDLVLLRRRLVD